MLSGLSRLSGLVAAGISSFLLTYLLHSTLLLGGTSVLLRFRRIRPAWEETLWKLAMFGALFTAAAHALLDVDPFVDAWEITSLRPGIGSTGTTTLTVGTDSLLRHWLLAVSLLWLIGAIVHLTGLAGRQRRLMRLLAHRRPVRGRVRRALEEAIGGPATRAPVRLTALEGLQTPLAVGRREVVVPPALADHLPDAPLRGVLAHEVGHLVRRDPAWSLAAGVVEALFFFQPMNGMARRRLAELAEFEADGWAVRRTGSRLALARGLEGVALSLRSREARLAGVPALGERRAGLVGRVRRILNGGPENERSTSIVARLLLSGGALTLLLLAAPSFSPIHDADDIASDRAAAIRTTELGAAARRPAAEVLSAPLVPPPARSDRLSPAGVRGSGTGEAPRRAPTPPASLQRI
jgi:Zn-dependent protease with chaperone function